MGKYKSEYIFFEEQSQRITDVVHRAEYYASRNREMVLEVIMHLMDHAVNTHDDALFQKCHELMALCDSPSPYMQSCLSLSPADDNNLPPVTADGDANPWDDSLDAVFCEKYECSKIAAALQGIHSEHLSGKRYWYVAFKVLLKYHYIEVKKGNQRNFLQWANQHFNCGWKESQLNFGDIDDRLKNTDVDDWNENIVGNKEGQHYVELAEKMKSEFAIAQVFERPKRIITKFR